MSAPASLEPCHLTCASPAIRPAPHSAGARKAAHVAQWHDARVGSKRERRAGRALVAAYHEARLGELVEHVAEAVDRFRAGEQDAFDVDEVLHHYQRAARELWKFCWLAGAGAGVELTARLLRDMVAEGQPIDWWARGAPRDRRAQRDARDAGSPLAPETRPENPGSSLA